MDTSTNTRPHVVLYKQKAVQMYKVDYSTTILQVASKMCGISDEILSMIAGYCVAGFGLEFGVHSDKKGCLREAVFTPSPTFPTAGLNILRLCKYLRRKFLRVLVNATSDTLQIYHWKNIKRSADLYHDASFISRLLASWQVPLPPAFATQIRRLELDSLCNFVPDLGAFVNLAEVRVTMIPWLCVKSQALVENQGAMLCVSRYVTGEDVSWVAWRDMEYVLARPWYEMLPDHVPLSQRGVRWEVQDGGWVGEMVRWLEERDTRRGNLLGRVLVEVVHGVVVQVQQEDVEKECAGENGGEVGEWQWWKITREVTRGMIKSERVRDEMWENVEKKLWGSLRRIPAQYRRD